MDEGSLDPYCGFAPTPHDLLAHWNFDPVLIIAIALSMSGLFALTRARKNRVYVLSATFLLFLAFISPLCALTSSLFSARAVHHLLITSVIAPLVVLTIPRRSAFFAGTNTSFLSAPVFLVVLWAWHLPAAYSYALSGTLAYWIMQGPLVFTSVWLWRDLISSTRRPEIAAVSGLFTVMQMSLLGALLTFASRPLFAPHFLTTEAYGLGPHTDQQLAGLIMWVPSALPFILVAVYNLAILLKTDASTASRA